MNSSSINFGAGGYLPRDDQGARVAGCCSEGAGRRALGFVALGLLSMSVVGFLGMFGLRVLRFYLRLKRNTRVARVASRTGCV